MHLLPFLFLSSLPRCDQLQQQPWEVFVSVTLSTTYNVGNVASTLALWQLLALSLLERWWNCFLKCQNCCSELRFCLIIGCRWKGNGHHLSPLPLQKWEKNTIFSPEMMWNAVMLPCNERSPCSQTYSKILLFWLQHSRCHFQLQPGLSVRKMTNWSL